MLTGADGWAGAGCGPFAVHLVWVNVHILFVMGLCLIGIFALDALVTEGFRSSFKLLAAVGMASVLLSFVNPFGVAGFLEPFNIFKVYGTSSPRIKACRS